MGRLTAEQLNASKDHDFTFKEEEVELEQLGGTVLLKELTVNRRSKLLKGITDENGNVSDVQEFQVRMFAASCIDPQLKTAEVRKFLPKWPSGEADKVFGAIGRIAPDSDKEAANAEAEFQDPVD